MNVTNDQWIVGRPIHVEKSEKPTLEQVRAVQKEYIEELYRYVYLVLRRGKLLLANTSV